MQAFGLSCLGRTRHRTLPLPTSVAHTIATGNSFGSGGITTTGINTTGATLLVIGINGYQAVGNAEGNGITITDTFSNKWYLVANGATAPNPGLAIFYCPSPTVGASHTVNIVMGDEGAGGYVSFSAWSNTHALVAIGENANSGSSEIAAPFKGGSIAPGLTNDLVLSFIAGYNGRSSTSGLPASIDSSFAILDSEFNATPAAGGGLGGFSIAYLIAPNTSALNPTWTMQSIVTSAMVSNVVFAQVSTAAVQLVNYINASSGSTLTTSPIDTTGANFIIASVQKYVNTGGPNGFSDNKGNTWHLIPWNNGQDYGKPAYYYAYNATVGTGHTFSTTVGDCAVEIMAFSGVRSSSDPLESANDSATIESSSTFQSAAAITPASAGDLVITAIGNVFASNPLTIYLSVDEDNLTSGWTPANSNDPAGAIAFSIAQDNSTPLQPTWTALSSGSQFNRGYNNLAVFAHA